MNVQLVRDLPKPAPVVAQLPDELKKPGIVRDRGATYRQPVPPPRVQILADALDGLPMLPAREGPKAGGRGSGPARSRCRNGGPEARPGPSRPFRTSVIRRQLLARAESSIALV